jgi:hypothetical protein
MTSTSQLLFDGNASKAEQIASTTILNLKRITYRLILKLTFPVALDEPLLAHLRQPARITKWVNAAPNSLSSSVNVDAFLIYTFRLSFSFH